MNGVPAADEAERRRTIDEVSVTGGRRRRPRPRCCTAPTHFTDYFVLLKVNGKWKIANKVYDAARRG